MKPLIDSDILLYELGFCGEYDDDDGEHHIREFEFVKELLDAKIEQICFAVGATEPPRLYFTGKDNFRDKIAQKKGYKANRKEKKKPFHYGNIRGYLEAVYDTVTAEGMEADDLLVVDQMASLRYMDANPMAAQSVTETVICSRDKDLRMCPGWQYGWECGAQAEWGPKQVSPLGELTPKWKDEEGGKMKKLAGEGISFFYAQLIMGDSVDNIPGIPGLGDKKAWLALKDCEDEDALRYVACNAYEEKYGAEWVGEMEEQAYLLWMVRELNEDGSPVMWKIDEDYV